MAEILTIGATEILNKLVGVVAREIGSAWGVKDDLEKLRRTLETILAVMADAEKRQQTDELVRLWLRRLKDAAYDADDVMDEFSYQTIRRSERGDSLKHKVRDMVSSSNILGFRYKMATKIKDINRRLDEITEDKVRFQLEVAKPDNTSMIYGENSEQRSRHTTSFSNEPEIVGRENDKNQILDMLTKVTPSSLSDKNLEKVSVVSIVGMGGLGKTTLAQLVYQDELVRKQFEPKMWVHVSESFDVENLLTKIMESSVQKKFDILSNFDVLVGKVREQLEGKKYLLVLDDMWNEDEAQWDRLKSVLHVGAQGSKILITTRKSQVASIVQGIIRPYNLQQLPYDACWSMIEQKAFSPGGALETQEMINIGKEIAKKCCGLPLAAKFLGGLLHSRNKESDWISIKGDDICTAPESQSKILPILRLSYNNLSSHLKQCFSFCSIFPKNWVIRRETLVRLWMAEGFLKPTNVDNKRLIEDFGDECFESLVWSSFFHNLQMDDLGDTVACEMHDLVHDLAEDVFWGNERVSLKANNQLTDVSKFRRLQLDLDEDSSSTFLKSLRNAKKLRTMLVRKGSNLDPALILGNKHLRVLHVVKSPNPDFPTVHSLSFKLSRRLRYLHLTSLDLSKLVDYQSISKLYNLETLVMRNMRGVLDNLLSNIQSLKNLRHLDISCGDMEELPDSVTSLCNLQTLDLHNCKLKAFPNSVTGLKYLRFLDLSRNPIEELPTFINSLFNLQTLDVNSCKQLKALPESVSCLHSLRKFTFKHCPLLKALPEDFGALTQLRSVNSEGTGIKVLPESCSNLRNLEIVNAFLCEPLKDVTNWTELRRFVFSPIKGTPMGIGKLLRLRELVYCVGENAINKPGCGIEELGNLKFLEKLHIYDIQNVKNLTSLGLSWVKKGYIDAERANLKGKENLVFLELSWFTRLIWSEVEKLGMRWDRNSSNFQVFEALQPPTSLKTLRISSFMGSVLPTWCVPSGLPCLEILELANCGRMRQVPAAIGQLTLLRYLYLTGMSYLKSLDTDGFASLIELHLTEILALEELRYSYPCLQTLRIRGCKSLKKIPFFPSLVYLELEQIDYKSVSLILRSQTFITSLFLENIEQLVFFPLSILKNHCNFQHLQIKECSQFEGFRVDDDENGKEGNMYSPEFHTGSLRTLVLISCAMLKFLPDLRRWTSLQHLTIFNCPRVEESLTYDPKSLSFLNSLYVDFIEREEYEGNTDDVNDLINLMNEGEMCARKKKRRTS